MDGGDGRPLGTPAGGTLTKFLVEVVPPVGGWGRLQDLTESARRGARSVGGERTEVRFLRAIYLPEDDSCLFLFEGSGLDAVREAGRSAGLSFRWVLEARPMVEGGRS